MAFDACEHRVRGVVIKTGQLIRQLKGLPEERDVTILFNEAAPLLGIPAIQLSSRQDGNHLPAPHEMKNEKGSFLIPRRDCPQCGRKDGLSLVSLCPSCTDSEGGEYHTMWTCIDQGAGCGFKMDKSKKFITQVLSEMGVQFGTGTKESLGIKTYTDEGLK